MKNNSIITLVEMRACILQDAEIIQDPAQDRKLDRIDRSLAELRAAEAQRQRQEERVKIMKEAISLGLWRELQHFIEEAKRERVRPYCMSNGTMADLLYRYLKTIWPETETIKYEDAQWIMVTDRQKQELRRQFEECMRRRIDEQIRMQRALTELRRITDDADRKRNDQKAAR